MTVFHRLLVWQFDESLDEEVSEKKASYRLTYVLGRSMLANVLENGGY